MGKCARPKPWTMVVRDWDLTSSFRQDTFSLKRLIFSYCFYSWRVDLNSSKRGGQVKETRFPRLKPPMAKNSFDNSFWCKFCFILMNRQVCCCCQVCAIFKLDGGIKLTKQEQPQSMASKFELKKLTINVLSRFKT